MFIFLQILRRNVKMDGFITLKWRNRRVIVAPEDIIYVESYNRHLVIHTSDGSETEIVGKLSEFMKLLPQEDFVITHKSFAVNMNYISCFDKDGVILKDSSELPVSVRKRSKALMIFDDFSERGS